MVKKIIFAIVLFLFLNVISVKAEVGYNGGAGTAAPSVGGCNPSWRSICAWNNKRYKAVKLSLVYYDGSNRIKLGDSFIWIDRYYPYVTNGINWGSHGLTGYEIKSDISSGTVNTSSYGYNSAAMERYFTSMNERQVVDWVKSKLHVTDSQLKYRSDRGIGLNKRGYRILIEPFVSGMYHGSSGYGLYYFTMKEMMRVGVTNSNSVDEMSLYLHTKYDDIGIRRVTGPTSNPGIIANANTGYGYNIVNINIEICYKLDVSSSPNKLYCDTTNKTNSITFSEVFKETDCTDGNRIENASEYGRLVKTVNNDCKIYCKETVTTELPGNVSPAITIGRYFIWPSFGTTINDLHQLNITGKRLCTKVGKSCGSYTPKLDDLYKDFDSDVKIKYNDKEYKFDNLNLSEKNSSGRVYTKAEYQNQYNIAHQEDYIAERKVSLKLPDNLYSYYNTSTKKYSNTKDGEDSEIVKYKNGILPISLNENILGKKTMQLYEFKLGANGVFSSAANKALSDYICTYKVTTDEPSPCICPPGTEHSGEDLWCKLVDSGGENCPTQIEKYCNDTSLDLDDLVCDDKPKFCPEPYEHISIEKCVKAGNSYQNCVNKYCNGNPPKYECPKNDDSGNTEWMDITGCVEELLAKGKSETEAINYCKDVVCPADGLNIIYRTISLRNPFPSKTLSAGIYGFNLDVNGRYPGANWNSRELVKTAILNNRNISDPQQIYHKKKPLYKIILNPANTKAVIQYNRSQISQGGYQDFTLKCYGKNAKGEPDGSECLSEFLKDASGAYGVVKNESVCYQKTGAEFEGCRS